MKEIAPYSVGTYLELLNGELVRFRATVVGEVSSVDIRGTYLFFKLKDQDGEGMLSCFMWKRSYDASDVELREGMLVAAEGVPEIYKPRGTLSFQAARIAAVGEGELKKQYDTLRLKLETEGLFSDTRKRPMPDAPRTIALITSETGAVIHDFLHNLGQYGFAIRFHDSRVEGRFAESDLLAAIRAAALGGADAVAIIRGGGSLESLAAFNSEALVRAIAESPIPVIAGIGHDKDVPLAALAADFSVSTPTAAAELFNRAFEAAALRTETLEQGILERMQAAFDSAHDQIRRGAELLVEQGIFFSSFGERQEARLRSAFQKYSFSFRIAEQSLLRKGEALTDSLATDFQTASLRLAAAEKSLAEQSPERALALGWSIVRGSRGIVRSVADAKVGEHLALEVSDGTIHTLVENLKWHPKN